MNKLAPEQIGFLYRIAYSAPFWTSVVHMGVAQLSTSRDHLSRPRVRLPFYLGYLSLCEEGFKHDGKLWLYPSIVG